MAEGLKSQNNSTYAQQEAHSPKLNTSRGSPALSTDLKKEPTIKSFRSSRSLRSNLKNITSNNQSQQNNIPNTGKRQQNNTKDALSKDTSTKKTVLKSIRNLFVKASINLSIAAARLKSFAEDALSSDEIVNELFLVTSSSSVDSSLLELQEEPLSVDQNNNHQPDQAVTGGGQELANTNTTGETESRSAITSTDMTVNSSSHSVSIDETTYETFDSVAEARKLQREKGESEPFIDGELVWTKRREAWLYSTSEERTKAKQKSLENSLVGISKDNYPIIYNSLIEKQKTLKKPMNLKDALKVINAGWIASKKWERATQGLP